MKVVLAACQQHRQGLPHSTAEKEKIALLGMIKEKLMVNLSFPLA